MIRLVCLLAPLLLLLGCPAKTAPAPKTAPPPAAKSQEGRIGIQGGSQDPVCGKKVDATAPARVERDGKTYFFCSEACAKKFKAAPENYLASQAKTKTAK